MNVLLKYNLISAGTSSKYFYILYKETILYEVPSCDMLDNWT